MSTDDAYNYGWGFPAGSRKAHYFDADGRSLCGKWAFMRREACDNDNAFRPSPDDCVACRRKFTAAYGTRETP
jgi:hypothetical protein